jgi:hypothetical protein
VSLKSLISSSIWAAYNQARRKQVALTKSVIC